MNGVQLLLVVVIGAIAVTALANRRGLQAPLVVVVVALAVSFTPGLPRLELDPEILLGIVLPPLLYSTALDFSLPSFVRNLYPILRLGVGLVVVTAFAVGGVGGWALPGLTFGVALVLGAVVAPPDAVTAVAIGRRLGVPRRVMAILTGESLVNDAAALTFFSVAVAAVAGTRTFVSNPVLYFVYTAVAGVLVGLLIGLVVQWIRVRLDDPGLATVLGLVVPFLAYLLAEEVHGSGVLAVVIAGFWLGHTSASAGFASRLQERQVWNSVDVLLEAFVFAYMGLQLRFVIEDLQDDGEPLGRTVLVAAVVLAVTILVRPAWIALAQGIAVLVRRLPRRRGRDLEAPPWRATVLISWTGMRGVVTLAAAAGVPVTTSAGDPFPGRATIQFVAFVVAVGTLLIQGPTLPWLVRRLDLSTAAEEEAEQAERRHAQAVSREAAREAVREVMRNPPEGADPQLLEQVADRLRQAQEIRQQYLQDGDPDEQAAARHTFLRQVSALRRRMLGAQRAALIRERDAGNLDDEVLRDVLEQLDWEEAANARGTGQRL